MKYLSSKFANNNLVVSLLALVPILVFLFVPSLSGVSLYNGYNEYEASISNDSYYCKKIIFDSESQNQCTQKVAEANANRTSFSEPNNLKRY